MVKTKRDQSQEAPRIIICSRMRPRYWFMNSQTRSRNFSRPRSWRVSPSLASSFSTTHCPAMPAWSAPGIQSVGSPSMRCQRIMMSSTVDEEGVADVQLAGHVRRRHDDDERLAIWSLARLEIAGVVPAVVDAGLDQAGIVGLGKL